MGYALWLVPSDHELAALQRFMAFRPKTYRKHLGSRSYPIFTPHITLVTFSTPTLPKLQTLLPEHLAPAPVFFESMEVGNNYLSALSVSIARSKSDQLMIMHSSIVKHMRRVSGIETKSRRFPHMSLFYVDEEGARRQLGQELIQTKRVTVVQEGREKNVWLSYDPEDRGLFPTNGFTGEQIWLVDCTSKEVEGWQVKERHRLTEQRKSFSPATPAKPASFSQPDFTQKKAHASSQEQTISKSGVEGGGKHRRRDRTAATHAKRHSRSTAPRTGGRPRPTRSANCFQVFWGKVVALFKN